MNYFLSVLQNYAVFTGRARRSEFWYFALISTLISITLAVIGKTLDFPILRHIYTFAILLPAIGVSIRRMHDIGKSGWYYLIPIYNIILFATAGDIGDNEYGSDPKAV